MTSTLLLAFRWLTESWITGHCGLVGIHLWYQTKNTFVNISKSVGRNWIAVFAREQWEALQGVCTNDFLHFQEFSEDATCRPNINRLIIIFVQEDQLRSTIPSSSDSQSQLHIWIWQFFLLNDAHIFLLLFFLGFDILHSSSHSLECFLSSLAWTFLFCEFSWRFCLAWSILLLRVFFLWRLLSLLGGLFNGSRKPKIANFYCESLRVDQDVGRLEITMNDVGRMKVLNSK